jgi:hypothetical protein
MWYLEGVTVCLEMSLNRSQFLDLLDRSGDLGRPVPSGKIAVPEEVWKDGDMIRWRMGERARHREVSRNMLEKFVRLTDADSILTFAKAWGVLALAPDVSRPPAEFESNVWSSRSSHSRSTRPTFVAIRYVGERLLRPGRKMKEGAEPIAAWQYYSRRARGLLNIAVALKLEKRITLEDWREIGVGGPEDLTEEFMYRHIYGLGFAILVAVVAPGREDARRLIQIEVESWHDCWRRGRSTGLSDFALAWIARRRWNLEIDYHGLLFPAIALQLALAIADADSLFICSACNSPYPRPREKRRPKPGWANYCDACSEDPRVANNLAVDRLRAKKREVRRMHLSGVPISEIAEKFKATVAAVRSWIDAK